jgi:hypothetical protein
MLSPIFEKFVRQSPITVMARGMIERVLNPTQLDDWFSATAEQQYTKDLLFSTVFDVVSHVVYGKQPSIHAAYQASKAEVGVSVTSLYNKLNGIEPNTAAELVRYASRQVEPVIKKIGGTSRSPLPGLRIKLLDGNCIEKSQHRIQELRFTSAGPLPGKSLVVYDPVLRLPIDVFPCEDGHAQERCLLKAVLGTVESGDVWIADRNFCTVEFTCGIESRGSYFAIREHKLYPSRVLSKEKYIGKTETGKAYEQKISVTDGTGAAHTFRRLRIHLDEPTRDGDSNISIICNLSKSKAGAKIIAKLYQGRWTIETAFQHLTQHFNSEINTLGYPRAALFAFCVALVAYIVMSVTKAALGRVYGIDVVENQISGYYLSNEISATYLGMMIATDDEDWRIFREMSPAKLATFLKQLAANVTLSAFRKHPRGPKKPPPKRKSSKNTPHVSTAKLLAKRNK